MGSKDKFQAFTKALHARHQHYVPLIDAAIGIPKEEGDSYRVYKQGHELEVFMKDPDGSEFIGEVWPG